MASHSTYLAAGHSPYKARIDPDRILVSTRAGHPISLMGTAGPPHHLSSTICIFVVFTAGNTGRLQISALPLPGQKTQHGFHTAPDPARPRSRLVARRFPLTRCYVSLFHYLAHHGPAGTRMGLVPPVIAVVELYPGYLGSDWPRSCTLHSQYL